jgi:hypothetical protein
MTDELRTVAELAAHFGVHPGRIRDVISRNRIEPASRSAHGARADKRLYSTSALAPHFEAQQ